MTNFSILWDTKVKQLALQCINPDLIKIAMKEECDLTNEEIDKAKEIGKMFKDPMAMYYISDMAWKIEHALADDREFAARMAIIQVYSVISSDSYWENVFNNDKSSEEAKNILALRDALTQLLNA